MRQILSLTEQEYKELEQGYKTGKKHHFRLRCQAILLSYEGFSVPEIALRLNKKKDTIYTWLNKYENQGIKGLENKPGQGVKAKLNDLTKSQIKKLEKAVADEPQNLNKVSTLLSEEFGFKITKWMLISFLKKS